MAKTTLVYWDIRGLAEPIRLMLEYCSVDYEEKRYSSDEAEVWRKDKFQLGLDFPNLPYYVDGEIKISESMAIMKYIARKYGLFPGSEENKRKCDTAEGVIGDIRTHFAMMCYLPDFEKNKATFFEALPGKMELMNKYLTNNKWLAGDQLSYIDFVFSEWLSQLLLMEPKSLENYSNVTTYYDNFFKMEKISAYRKSKKFKKFPINGKTAQWGGNAE